MFKNMLANMFAALALVTVASASYAENMSFTTEVEGYTRITIIDSVTAIPLDDLLDTNSGNGHLGTLRVKSNVDYTLNIEYDGIKINGTWYGKFVNSEGGWIAARVFYDPFPDNPSTTHLVYADPGSNDGGALNIVVDKDAPGGRNKVFAIGADVVPTRNSYGDELPDAGLYTLPVTISIGQ